MRLLGQYLISDARAGFSTLNRDARTDFQLNLDGPGLVTWHRSDVQTMIVSRRLRENPEEHNGNPGGAYEWEGEDGVLEWLLLALKQKIFRNEGCKDNDKAGKRVGMNGCALSQWDIFFRTYFCLSEGHFKIKIYDER